MTNWMVISISKWFNKVIKKEEQTDRLIGIYPTYKEAAFIRDKIGTRSKQIKIESTNIEPTSTKVNDYLTTIEQRSK